MIGLRALFPIFWRSELRRFKKHFILGALCSAVLLFPSPAADEHASAPVVLDLDLHGVVEPILATYIDEGITDAERRQAALILITMDTPGGLSDSMQDIIKHILASRVPVAVYITPTGALPPAFSFCFLRILPPWLRAPIREPLRRSLRSADGNCKSTRP
jgi:hypothetical protein